MPAVFVAAVKAIGVAMSSIAVVGYAAEIGLALYYATALATTVDYSAPRRRSSGGQP